MTEPDISKQDERVTFLVLAVFLAPFLSIVLVGGYGFVVWIMQMIMGPHEF